MKTLLYFLLLLAITISAYSNDGTYLSRGSIIYPVQETKISLEKENLSFTVRDRVTFVNIHFEFFNPEDTVRKVLVGFQAPTASGDLPSGIGYNQVSDFTVIKDGEILPYTIKIAECEDCKLKDLNEANLAISDYAVLVFLFEATFHPGLNQINHSYTFPASGNVAIEQIYSYILRTGSKWADGTIKDLTVKIDMGPNKYFYVHDVFGATAEWFIVGTGKLTDKSFSYDMEDSIRMVRILSGNLAIKVKDFRPEKNIEFGFINEYAFTTWPVWEPDTIQQKMRYALGQLYFEDHYTKHELRIMRNTLYAQHGYDFKSEELKEYFLKFTWYIPNPNLRQEDIILSTHEMQFLEAIQKREKE